ncbi:SRPBCC family protein [Microbulbifer rhizosphaerae]|uniref:Polyketide cyclase / dehydrase and lipid transport n=1 Tax=Microbulbifer rhizosphaerae TaxID=1562603 RepID=A0A7W4W9M5_9GAMM|nr:hypothetical protein [Microbulbifer rhizosphaerae]MBB3059571.1 hypothetical protein [Microbulbifer rhizosphaerae]
MKKKILLKITILLGLCVSFSSVAQINNLETNLGGSYYYVDHFETVIDKPVDEVWPHVVEMSKWMPWMAADSESNKISEGDRIHLYGGFYIEVVKIIPKKMIVLANLPNVDRGEQSQGIAMVSVAEANGKTLVSIFMSRIYNWFDSKENPQRATRESSEFSDQRKATFKDNFLVKLKQLAET